MKLSELEYELPAELIAQHPAKRRDESRLLVFDRASGEARHRTFGGLPDELGEDTLVVVNDTRVIPARIPLERPRGEVLLLEPTGEDGLWEALARPTRRLRPGRRVRGVRRSGRGGPSAPRRGRCEAGAPRAPGWTVQQVMPVVESNIRGRGKRRSAGRTFRLRP